MKITHIFAALSLATATVALPTVADAQHHGWHGRGHAGWHGNDGWHGNRGWHHRRYGYRHHGWGRRCRWGWHHHHRVRRCW